MFSCIVFNDGQWSVELVLDSNALTIVQQLTKVRRKWIEQQQTKTTQDNFSTKESIL